jgi:hypothetical protein
MIKMIVPPAPEFKVLSVDDQYGCNDKTSSHRHLGLSFDELRMENNSKTSLKVLL